MSMFQQKVESVIHKLKSALDDAKKIDDGKVGSPGARLRKITIEVTKDLKHIRDEVIVARAAKSTGEG